jgi:hypothetical protein
VTKDVSAEVREKLRPIVEDTMRELAQLRGCAVSELSVGEERAIETALMIAWMKCEAHHNPSHISGTWAAAVLPPAEADDLHERPTRPDWSTPAEDATPVAFMPKSQRPKRKR